MPCLESARSRARGGDEREREGREIYDKATLILIHGTSVSILSNSFPPFEARKNRDEGKEGKKDLPSRPRALLLPRRRLLPPPRRRQVEDESQGGGGGLVGVEAGGGRSRAVYLRRRRRRRLVMVVVDSLSRSILIDARLERRLFHSGLKQRAPALNER